MEANELRIGNLVHLMPERHREKSIIEIDANALVLIEEESEDYRVSGIPLTEEWLVKFGAYKASNALILKLMDGEIYYEDGKIFLCYGDYAEASDPLVHIKHVHSLQNLYFALTGEELEIK